MAQWEHFIQKGGQNFFLFRFLLFGIKKRLFVKWAAKLFFWAAESYFEQQIF
jgi:hypothetical protein